MSALIDASFDTNYDDDQELLDELNKHLGFDYDEESNNISFNIDFAKNDHYVVVSVDKDELLDAIERAVKKPLE